MHKKILSIIFAAFIFFGSFMVPESMSLVEPVYSSDMTTFLDGIKLGGTDGAVTIDPGKMEDDTGANNLDPNKLFLKYRNLAIFITGLLTATALFTLFWNISKLSTALDNEFSRRRITLGIATSAVGVALLGSATVILAFFYQFFGS